WRSLTGVDLDEALLDWVGGSWHSATLDVLATDLRAWAQGPPSVATVAVTSEAAAERGIELLLEAFANVYDAIDAFAAAMGAETSTTSASGPGRASTSAWPCSAATWWWARPRPASTPRSTCTSGPRRRPASCGGPTRAWGGWAAT